MQVRLPPAWKIPHTQWGRILLKSDLIIILSDTRDPLLVWFLHVQFLQLQIFRLISKIRTSGIAM